MNERTLEEVARIERLCFSTPWSIEALKAELKNPLAVFSTASVDGVVAGYAGMHDVMGEGYITNIATLPEHRRLGIARALLQSMLQYVADNEMSMITLEVRKSNIAAISLYREFGFEKMGERKGFYSNPCEDAVIMTRQGLSGPQIFGACSFAQDDKTEDTLENIGN